VQVSIEKGMIENKNRVTGRSKIPHECKNGDFWATGGYISSFFSCETVLSINLASIS
jgi:hypothetical protein